MFETYVSSSSTNAENTYRYEIYMCMSGSTHVNLRFRGNDIFYRDAH